MSRRAETFWFALIVVGGIVLAVVVGVMPYLLPFVLG